MRITIGWLYPDLMNTYGDRGNVICLVRRCQWRKIEVEVRKIGLEQSNNKLLGCDLIFMGGAQDRQQKIAADDLRKNKGVVLKEMIKKGIPGLFVCGAYQFLGNYYQPGEGERIKGLGIFNLKTIHFGMEKKRCIGNVVIKKKENVLEIKEGLKFDEYMVGFENHGGRTYLGKGSEYLGKVLIGFGNNGEDKKEGCVCKNAIGTYLHGPVLPKNPLLADFLIKTALEVKYKKRVKLSKLGDFLERKARKAILKRLNVYEKL